MYRYYSTRIEEVYDPRPVDEHFSCSWQKNMIYKSIWRRLCCQNSPTHFSRKNLLHELKLGRNLLNQNNLRENIFCYFLEHYWDGWRIDEFGCLVNLRFYCLHKRQQNRDRWHTKQRKEKVQTLIIILVVHLEKAATFLIPKTNRPRKFLEKIVNITAETV